MSNSGILTVIGVLMIAGLVVGQGYLFYRIMLLDANEQYNDIPFFLGLTVLLYATVLFIYLRIFIGIKAYKKVLDKH